jgi:hypothetical protein
MWRASEKRSTPCEKQDRGGSGRQRRGASKDGNWLNHAQQHGVLMGRAVSFSYEDQN